MSYRPLSQRRSHYHQATLLLFPYPFPIGNETAMMQETWCSPHSPRKQTGTLREGVHASVELARCSAANTSWRGEAQLDRAPHLLSSCPHHRPQRSDPATM